MLSSRSLTLRLLPVTVLLSLLGSVIPVCAQFGVSPSQTSTFFDDFRSRTQQMQESSAGYRTGDVVYDYESGTYTSDEQAQMRPDDLLREARAISQPAVRSGSAAVAARSVGDYTNYSGQYASPSGFFAPSYVSDPFLTGKRNLKLGPVNVGLGLYTGFEYNSNVTRSKTNPVSDYIGTLMLNISANYRVTQNNVLSISTAVGFDHYFSHPELAPYGNGNYVMNVLPGSTLAFDVKAGPVYITFYDRVSVRPAVNNAFALNALGFFGVFQNDAGMAVNWAINSKWSLSINYNNSISKALDKRFNQFNRQLDSIQTVLTFSPHGTWATGLEGGVSILNYEQQFLNDAVMGNAGVFFRTQLGSATTLRISGGLQNFDFKPPTLLAPLGTGDTNDLSDYYLNVSISNQINNRLSHVLSFGHESALNLTSNFITADYINYGMSIITSKGGRLSLTGFFENASPSLTTAQFPAIQYGFDTYYNQQITSKIRMGVGYHFGRTDSEGPANDFDQHAFNVDLTTAISQKASINLGYRYFLTNAYNSNFDFQQHRVILGLSYNF